MAFDKTNRVPLACNSSDRRHCERALFASEAISSSAYQPLSFRYLGIAPLAIERLPPKGGAARDDIDPVAARSVSDEAVST